MAARLMRDVLRGVGCTDRRTTLLRFVDDASTEERAALREGLGRAPT